MASLIPLGPASQLSKKPLTVPIICAWCKRTIGEEPAQGRTEPSHGICPECLESVRHLFHQEAKSHD